MPTADAPRLRQAALLVHGLGDAEKQRVMARLSAGELAQLRPMLAELVALGVSASLGRAMSSAEETSLPPVSALPVLEQVERLEARTVARCFQSCAPATIARLLEAGQWPWRSAVIEAMPAGQRAEVGALLLDESSAFAPVMLQTLCERLLSEVAGLRQTGNPAPGDEGRAFRPQARSSSRIVSRGKELLRWMR